MMTCTACLELQELEFTADEGRRIDENVVVGGVVTVASSFQARINLPTAGSVVFHATRHMFLAGEVHKNRGGSDVGHLICQQSRKDLVVHIEVVGSLFGDAPRLLVGLLPIQGLVPCVYSTEILNVASIILDAIDARRPGRHRNRHGRLANPLDLDFNIVKMRHWIRESSVSVTMPAWSPGIYRIERSEEHK